MENLEGAMPTAENGGENVVTPTTTVNTNTEINNTPVDNGDSENTAEKMYSRSQVEQLMKKRVERSHNSFFKRYNVQDLKGLDDLFEQTKKFSQMQDEYGAIQLKNAELSQENAFLRNNINPDRYSDIKAYFKGSDIEFSEDALKTAIATHPEWLKVEKQPEQTTIKRLGSEAHATPKLGEKEMAEEIFGVKFR